ncbi:MAG: tetrathionate reductase family octaheme c-type cytochrome, partial [Bacteroidota bacterium]|nr:tetrathionate reductase family octaheme c-type cytochrome [Bacteroidota bacterium]
RRHLEVMASNHWNWERGEYIEGRGIVYIGKRNLIGNYGLCSTGNERSCAKCHIGYGETAEGIGYTDPTNIDCLVCHDNTETYAKGQEMGGAPDPSVDLGHVARNVGKPRRTNCGVCHFYGGGGNNVKHGDLEETQFYPDRGIDVHMDAKGVDLSCVDCHKTQQHNISGKLYTLSSMNRNRVTCEQCHGNVPHEKGVLNEHLLKVSCQACHIPTYAKGNPTKLTWDWSAAGRLRNGQPYEEKDAEGNVVYLSTKGVFTFGKDVKPEYAWFNGTASHVLMGDVVADTSVPLVLNPLHGSYADPESKIIPVKVNRARQPFDPVNRILIAPKLIGERKGDGAYWQDFDWVRAAELGMRHVGLPFSGKVAFIRTEQNWPLNHMVAPKEQSVKCEECHTRREGRLASLTDFYLPGRDSSPTVETLGVILILLTFLGVLVHGGARIVARAKRERGGGE